MRTDFHKPSEADPAEYTFCAAFYQGHSDAMYEAYRYDFEEYEEWVTWFTPEINTKAKLDGAKKPNTQVFNGNYVTKGTCDHCGAAFAHGCLFLHVPSGDLIHIGHICASNTIGLPSKAAAAKKKAEKAAAAAKAHEKQMAKTAQWREDNAEVVSWLNSLENDGGHIHPFLRDMLTTLHKWGDLSERQLAATLKFKAAADKPKEQEPAPVNPVEEGRVSMTGTVVSTKYKEGFNGDPVLKMLVKLDDNNKVWGTVPAALDTDTLKGSVIEFTATVTKSHDDEHFGFFKRPTGATVILDNTVTAG